MNKNFIWAITIISIVCMICLTVLYLNHNAWTVRFEMDNNTREAIESIEFPIIDETPIKCFQRIIRYDRFIDYQENTVMQGYFYNTSWEETKCSEFEQGKYETLEVGVIR